MKRLVSALLVIFSAAAALGQNGNEWIDPSGVYVKIPIGRDGIYRVTHQSLLQAGFPVESDPRTFRIFHRGKEQAIYVEGEADGVFQAGDFVEFYGRRNDGTLDSTLYDAPSHQPHRYQNLYSDTTAFFLTTGVVHGKRMTSLSGLPASDQPLGYHRAERLMVFAHNYFPGVNYAQVHKSVFDQGEGWMGVQIIQGQELTYNVDDITDVSRDSGKPLLEVMLTGRTATDHQVVVQSGGRSLPAASFTGFSSYTFVHPIEWTDIDPTGRLTVKVRVTGASGPDRVSANYIRVMYPQKTTMAGTLERWFQTTGDNPGSLLRIEGAQPETRLWDITDPESPVRISTTLGSALEAVVGSGSRKIFATSQPLVPATIKKVSFRQFNPSAQDYVIVTHPLLRRPAMGLDDPVKAFAAHRSSAEGGGYDTLVVNIDQLYDQFNYGESSPRAIYQFMKFLATGRLPRFLFLVGKGLDINQGYWRNQKGFPVFRDLVPTAGYPASDMLFTAGLGNTPNSPAVATGRLTATSPAEVAVYLDKIREREQQPFDDLYRKKLIHISGGIEEHEPAFFREVLSNFQVVAEDLYLGGRVQPIAKQSTNIKLINIADEVNKGVGMITFFGHSAPNTLDFDIGLVSDPVMGYNNPGKYPFMLMNGCDAGSFFLNTNIIGENWIKTPGKGAIGFIAHSSYGLVFGLQAYSSTFYQVAFADSVFIRKEVGLVQREVARRFLDLYGSSAANIAQVQQMVLLGDPALRIFGADRPDYALVPGGINIQSFTDEPVTAFADSFALMIPVRNYGIARPERVRLSVQREYTDQVLEYDTIISSVLYEDTLQVVVRNPDHRGYGLNRFTIHIDADGFIEELNEDNNVVTFEAAIPLNSTRNLYPYNCGIVRDREVPFAFQVTDVTSSARSLIVEVDTTRNFDSPFYKTFTVKAEVLARKTVNIPDKDSVVYFWRTRIADPLEHESKEWALSSFTFIDDGPEGWAQLHFHQLMSNPSTGLVADARLRRIDFKETITDIAVRTFSTSAAKPLDSVSLKINGAEFNLLYEGGACRNNTLNLVAFDRRSTQPYAGLYFKWYQLLYDYSGRRLLCGREPYVINSFTSQELVTGKGDDLLKYIDNIAVGDSLLLFSIGNAGYAQWPAAAKTKLQEIGISSAQLSGLQNGDPVVIFARKGSPAGTAIVHRAPSGERTVRVKRTIAGRYTSGAFSSGLVGPAQRWDRMTFAVSEVEAQDKFSFDIIGIGRMGQEDTLRTGVQEEQDLSFIDADRYPYLKVVYRAGDDINLTSAQLDKWLVLFEPFAEGMVFPYDSEKLSVEEGQLLSMSFGFINVSDKHFGDSLLVRFDLLNPLAGKAEKSFRIGAPQPGDTTTFSVPVVTRGRAGQNDVQVYVNPRIIPEKSFDNNLVYLPNHLEVVGDRIGPVVDVRFEGRHIRDGEHVSASPLITVRVLDENRFMLKRDTTGVQLFLAGPCGADPCDFKAIHFSANEVSWEPATETSPFSVRFSPRELQNGEYLLRVNAEDGSGNRSGDFYQIRFRVNYDRTITVTQAYPNPFFLETSLDVIITGGEELPTRYRLVVAGLDGRQVVDRSGKDNVLHIGLNRITWDGRGNGGESLPDGIYFYRLIVTGPEEESTYQGKILLLR